jgi:hypothetical protein
MIALNFRVPLQEDCADSCDTHEVLKLASRLEEAIQDDRKQNGSRRKGSNPI